MVCGFNHLVESPTVIQILTGRPNSIYLYKKIHYENASTYKGYVYTHEHDFKIGHMYAESDKQLLTCRLCDISYCEECGKEVSAHTYSSDPPTVSLNGISP
jgi:hypothetical protein